MKVVVIGAWSRIITKPGGQDQLDLRLSLSRLGLMERHALFLFAALILVACSRMDRSISAQITEQFDASNSAPIDLARVGPPIWERVCVLGPYATNEAAEKILGFKWDVQRQSSIVVDDRINLVLFLKNDEVLAFTEHRRDKGDFLDLKPRCLARTQAILVRRAGADGLVQLVPE